MKEFGRKSYLSKSYADMMKRVTNAASWAQRVEKHSEFEKPGKRDNYPEMQHYYPTNHLPGADYPDMPSGGQPSVSLQWWGCRGSVFTKYSSGDCLSVDGTATVEFRENTDGGPGFGGDPIVDFKLDHPLELVSVVCEKATALTAYVYATVRLKESTTATSLHVTAITELGETCTSRVDICPCDCEGISIGYTTQQMAVDEEQNLTVVGAESGCTYDWALSGGGELSASSGTSITYTAPSTNANCANNATITLSVGGSQCDSLEIAVNAKEGDYAAVSVWTDKSCRDEGTFAFCKANHYRSKCDGTYFTGYDPCEGGEVQTAAYETCDECYDKSPQYTLGCLSGTSSINYLVNGSPWDLRSEAYIEDGCCPALLL